MHRDDDRAVSFVRRPAAFARVWLGAATLSALIWPVALAKAERPVIPEDFPRFVVPGEEAGMTALREMFYLHYQPAGPLSTLWDEWIPMPTLWPALAADNRMETIRQRWSAALSARVMEPEGYVATHQHASIAHQHGWPFPFWAQGAAAGGRTWGWHFSLANVPPGWHGTQEKTQEGWKLTGGKDLGITDQAWNLELTEAGAWIETPSLDVDSFQAPFLQLRWRATGLGNAQPYVEWSSPDEDGYGESRRFHFAPVESTAVVYTMIPVFQSPAWKGTIKGLRINFDNPSGARVGVQALFTQYDTRHNINNSNYIRGCCQYFWWTRDLNFLRANINRLRHAMRYMMHDLGGLKEKCILAPFPGHDGRSGLAFDEGGKKRIRAGHGIGHNYWDLLPFGYKDCYATYNYYDSLLAFARLEEEIAVHPEWNVPLGALRCEPGMMREHAREVRDFAGKLFWNEKTGRFISGLDVDGKSYDYGLTFLNLEAIHYGFATDGQADSILQWIEGRRTVEGDTSTGTDIYHWRFAPRATTRRNVEWYFFGWTGPETIPWGGQVQDGGAVLGFSYHDLMARLAHRGANDAWARLTAIAGWFEEVQKEGGYREYYRDPSRGTLQGGGPPGGLGMDREFFESILVPQVMLSGFLGFKPRGDGFELQPKLPESWPSLAVTRIRLHRSILDVTFDAKKSAFEVRGTLREPMALYIPAGPWVVEHLGADGASLGRAPVAVHAGEGIRIDRPRAVAVRITHDPERR